jgi:hypothetical protein
MTAVPVDVGIIRHGVLLARRGYRYQEPRVSYLVKSVDGKTGDTLTGWQSPFDAHRTGAMRRLRVEPLFTHCQSYIDYQNARTI